MAPQAVTRPVQRRLPPGPPLPKAVQTVLWSMEARRMLFSCQDRYGDMFTLRVAFGGTWVILAHPEAVKQVFTGDPRVFHAGEGNQILAPIVGRNSILLLDEKAHIGQRKLLLPPFHGERMQGYEKAMGEITAREVESWPTGTPYQLRPRMQAITLDIILRTIFGVSDAEKTSELREALRDFLDLTVSPRLLFPLLVVGPGRVRALAPFRRRVDRVNHLLYKEIAERRKAKDLEKREDILSMLATAEHEDGSPMSDEEMRDELLTLVLAGHETTATSLSWALERLSHHPEKLDRLRSEVETDSDEYLTATIQETLRLRPVVPIVIRRLTEPVEIGGYELPAGVSVVPSIYLAHRNPEVYPEPESFQPERFIDNPPGTYTWIPFGGGVRRCLGASFGRFEMAVVLREVVKRRDIRPAKPKPERIFRRAITETPRRNTEVILS